MVSQGWLAPAPRHGLNTGGSPTGKAGGRGHVEAGGRRLLEVGGWRHGARGGCTGHAAIFPRWTRGERARPLAWNLREVTQWTKIQPPAAASSPPAAAARGDGHAAKAAAPRSHAGGIFTRRGLALGFPSPCQLQGHGRARRQCPQGGRVQGMPSSVLQPLHRAPGLSLDLKQPLREKLSPSCQLVPGFVPFPAGGIARSTAGEERGLAEPEPSSWLTHGLPGCGAPAPGCSGTQDTPWPGDIPLHLAPSPVTCQQRPLVLAPLASHGIKRPGKCSPRGVPAAFHPHGPGVFCLTTRTHHEAAPRGCAWEPSFWSLCAIFRQSQGKGALPQNIPSLQRGAGHREHPGVPLPAPHPSGKVGEQREKPHFGGA